MAAPISDYINNPVFQKLLLKKYYFENKSDEKIYIDLRYSMRYTNETVKPSRNDTKLTVTIEKKKISASKKNEVKIKWEKWEKDLLQHI